MSQSTKRPSLSEASEASEISQPILNSTDCESDNNNDEPPPVYTEGVSGQSNDGVTTTGLNPVPELPKILKAGDTLTQHHDPELSDNKDVPPQSQCTEQPACGVESAPEIQITPSANRAMTRSPKRSSFPDASDALPKPKRHEREPPSDELESLRKPHITLPPPGRDILATEELGLLPDLCGGDDEHAAKQTVDSPAGSDNSGAGSYPSLASKLSSAPHLPPLIDEGAAPGELTSPSYPSLTPTLSSALHPLPLIGEDATPGEPTSPSHPSLAPELSSAPHMRPLASEGVTPGEPISPSHPSLAPELSSAPHIRPLASKGITPGEPISPSHPSLAPELSSTSHILPLPDEGVTPGEPTSSSLPVQTHTNDLASEEDQAQRHLKFKTYDFLMEKEKELLPLLWGRFMEAVEDFAQDCLPNSSSWDELPPKYQAEVQTWASNPQYYLNSKFSLNVRYFYTAWLFRLLNHHLFSGEDLDKWDGSDWQSFGTIWVSGKAHLNEPNGLFAVKYHHWRNLSVQTLADIHPEKRHVDQRWLRKKIQNWMNGLPFASEKKKIEHRWDTLIESAINMDSLIITARRDIQLRLTDSATHKKHSFPFVESKMDAYYASKDLASVTNEMDPESVTNEMDPVVDFVMFPTLLAYGQVLSMTHGIQNKPAERVLRPFGSSWDTISEEINMLVCCG